jgi:1-acyl-sn-glycerol-3-phosphate acyltransferase
MMKILEKPLVSKITWFILRPVGKIFIGIPYGLKKTDTEGLKNLKPPYLILPNHATMLDSALLGLHSRGVIRYVAADGNFRTGLQAVFFRLLGTIPKAKGVSEVDLIRTLMQIKNRGGILGIFPEGQSCWDGTTLPLIPATAKLVKLFKVPVVLPVIRGGYLCRPRWAFRRRARGMEVSYREVISAEELKGLSAEDILSKMEKILAWDDHRWALESGALVFNKRNRAEGIERLLFVCPTCQSMGTLRSRGNHFSCIACGLEAFVNHRGLFESDKLPVELTQERAWNVWQNRWLEEHLLRLDGGAEIFRDEPVRLYQGYKARRMKKVGEGSLSLFRDGRIVLGGEREMAFPLRGISALHVFKQDLLEFYHDNKLYRALFSTRRVSAYKWMQAVRLLNPD